VNATLKRLFALQPLQGESATGMKRFVDTAVECVRCLEVMERPVDQWGDILVYVIASKLDPESFRLWEQLQKRDVIPNFQQLTEFLDQQARVLANAPLNKVKNNLAPARRNNRANNDYSRGSNSGAVPYASSVQPSCEMCKGAHRLVKCKEFNNESLDDRRALIKDRFLCYVCFSPRHVARQRNVMQQCKKCSGKHHVLLHIEQNASGSDGQHKTQSTCNSVSTRVGEGTASVLLMTAVVNVRDRSGQLQQVRALLDSASEASFVSENIVQRLGLHKMRTNIPIAGISTSFAGRARAFVEMEFRSMYDQEMAFSMRALVLTKVTGSLPSMPVPPAASK
jgi:hypothetical protein